MQFAVSSHFIVQ